MNKRNFIQTIGCLLLLPLMLGACEESELQAVSQPQGEVLHLQSVNIMEDPAAFTRASVTSIAVISVYATKTTHAEYASNPLSTYTLSGGNWSSNNAPLIEDKAFLYAYYPAGNSVTNSATGSHTVPVSINVTAGSKDFKATDQNDYLYAIPAEGDDTNRAVSFLMSHTLTKVSFKVKKSTAATEALQLKSVEILSATSRLQTGVGTMNLKTGVLNGLASVSSLVLTDATGVALTTTQNNPNVTGLVAPMTASESILSFRLTVRVGGETTDRTFETKVVSAVQWLAGKHYVYTITVDKMKAGLNGMQIDDWKSDANQNTNIGI